MRILVPVPGSGDSFAHNVAHTLRKMGHEVRTGPHARVEATRKVNWLRRADNLLVISSEYWRKRRDYRIVKLAREFRPNLTLLCTATLEPNAIEDIRRESDGLVICWYGDSPANLRRGHLVSGEYDAVFLKDKDFVERASRILGISAFHLAEACNPDWHRPVTSRAGDDVLFSGNPYGYRTRLLIRLQEAGQIVKLYGPPVSAWVDPRAARAHTGVYLDHTTKARAFGRAMACVNSFSPAESIGAVNCRIFETCGCGGLLLTEDRKSIETYFEPGKEYLSFSDFDECVEHLERMQRDYRQASQVRARGAIRAHAEHTYEHRLNQILETIEMPGRQPSRY